MSCQIYLYMELFIICVALDMILWHHHFEHFTHAVSPTMLDSAFEGD